MIIASFKRLFFGEMKELMERYKALQLWQEFLKRWPLQSLSGILRTGQPGKLCSTQDLTDNCFFTTGVFQ